MRTPRFIAAQEDLSSGTPHQKGCPSILLARDAHHIATVLRLQPGAVVEVFVADSGKSLLCRLDSVSEAECRASVLNEIPRQLPAKRITLIVAFVKPKNCELIVEKAVELGAAHIAFFHAAKSRQTTIDETKWLLRLSRIRDTALKQCRAAQSAELSVHSSLGGALSVLHSEQSAGSVRAERIALMPPSGDSTQNKSPKTSAAKISPCPVIPPIAAPGTQTLLERLMKSDDFYIVVGPEGGLDERELALLAQHEYSAATFGVNVLRTETAALLACGFALL